VGEVHAALPLIERFLAGFTDVPVVVTTTTPTGSARVQHLLGKRVHHVYLPYDLPGAINRFLARYQPSLLVLLETELWPNLLQQCRTSQVLATPCAVLLVNARLSPKSFATYRKIGRLTDEMLNNVTSVAAQAQADGERFVALGLPADRLQVTGSLKFDMEIQQQKVRAAHAVKQRWQGRPVWIAASTREGEDALVLQAFKLALHHIPDLLLVLVPRHTERFAFAYNLAEAEGLKAQRYTAQQPIDLESQVVIGDTLGDMHFYYALADVAFVGGSLVPTGCQNLIEPAALGLPIITGPSLFNFQLASDVLRAAGGLRVVADVEGLAQALIELFGDAAQRDAMGSAASAVVAQNQGTTERLLELLQQHYCRNDTTPAATD
jgi:3-deoxy-D-manno-octulosonic-acid transferase